MDEKIKGIAKKMGAEVVGEVPDYSAGAFGAAALGETIRRRLEPGQGKRSGRPSVAEWTKRSKIPLAEATEERLKKLARLMSDEDRKVSFTQVAAQLLEDAAAGFFTFEDEPVSEPDRSEDRQRRRAMKQAYSSDRVPASPRSSSK